MNSPNTCLVQDVTPSGATRWLLFEEPGEVLQAWTPQAVPPVLQRIDDAIDRGLHAAGFLAYEAAAGLDPALQTQAPASALPVAWFGLYGQCVELAEPPEPSGAECTLGPWTPQLSEADYVAALGRIRAYLRDGATYQVNFTFPMRSAFAGDAYALFDRLRRAQRASCAAYVDTGRHVICSVSPELFFQVDGERIWSRPMKGTAPRGLTCEADGQAAETLRQSPKNRAENVMIVDMIRNDLGRIAAPGSVRVTDLFEIERYPTVLQMTSTVEARCGAPLSRIVRAMFPCASITGAPKAQTMRIIRELETAPRGVYCGAVGWAGPQRQARFNVAIRTVVVDRLARAAEYGVGGGVVWDSDDRAEYSECLTKARVLTASRPPFDLLETLLWERGPGFFLREAHLGRMSGSARYFGFPFDGAAARRCLADAVAEQDGEGGTPQDGKLPAALRVRLLLEERGAFRTEVHPVPPAPGAGGLAVTFAAQATDSSNVFLYHKTTQRAVYEKARAGAGGVDDVILWNERGEVTETTIANIVVEIDGERWTPPVSCGLLGGVFRAALVGAGEVKEKILRREDVLRADRVLLVNSVRRWVPARCV